MTNSGVTTDRRRLPVSDWPDLDRAIWRKETEAKDLIEARSPAVRWRPRTREGVAGAYGQWLAFLFSRGWLNQNQQPRERPTKARVLAYVESLQSECAPVTVGILIRGLYDAMRVLAPGEEPAWLRLMASRLIEIGKQGEYDLTRLVPIEQLYAVGFQECLTRGQYRLQLQSEEPHDTETV